MGGPLTEVEDAPSACPNCGRPLKEAELFCSLKCEREWLKRETAKAESEGILFCPHCGNPKLELAIPGLITIWKCPECGYRGSLAIKDGAMRSMIHEDFEHHHEEE